MKILLITLITTITLMFATTASAVEPWKDATTLSTWNSSDYKTKLTLQKNDRNFHWIIYDGTITEEAVDRVNLMLIDHSHNAKKHNQTISLVMDSNGGKMYAGMRLGYLIKAYRSIVYVYPRDKCDSSCATAALGARTLTLMGDAKLGFHAPYNTNSNGTITCATKTEAVWLKQYYRTMVESRHQADTLFRTTINHCSKTTSVKHNQAQMDTILWKAP